jgi:hypothetical protein
MPDVAECSAKLRTAGKISGKIADGALEFFNRSKSRIIQSSYAAPVKAESPLCFRPCCS